MKFEDFQVGDVYRSPIRHVTRRELLDFASSYDRQPLHLERSEPSPDALFDDVIGSGFLTIALTWQLWLDCGMQGKDGRGGLGLDGCRWYRPLRPDSFVQGVFTVKNTRVSSRGYGLVFYKMRLMEVGSDNQDERLLVEFTTTGIMARRTLTRST